MSTIEIETKELTEKEIVSLVSEILSNKEKYQQEAKYLLKLELERRISGCGYVYLFGYDFKILGEADVVRLKYEESYDCTIHEEVVIIPKTVPTIVIEHQYDEQPATKDKLTVHVFDGESWRSMRLTVAKPIRLSDILP